MNPKLVTRAAALTRISTWKWLPGMQDTKGRRLLRQESDGRTWEAYGLHSASVMRHVTPEAPDLLDEATFCLCLQRLGLYAVLFGGEGEENAHLPCV